MRESEEEGEREGEGERELMGRTCCGTRHFWTCLRVMKEQKRVDDKTSQKRNKPLMMS